MINTNASARPDLKKYADFLSLADQEIDFIAQLYVEFEQLTTYPDILESEDHLRSLASLFYDFTDRLLRIGKYCAEFEIWAEPVNRKLSADAGHKSGIIFEIIFSENTLKLLNPFLSFYRNYSEVYPAKLSKSEIARLFDLFFSASESSAQEITALLKNLRDSSAGDAQI
ncbi:MAG: hypothetical protein P8184_02705 [Calditrichia bacterium]